MTPFTNRSIGHRSLLLLVVAVLSAWAGTVWTAAQSTPKPQMTVYKSPTCGCCSKWIAHMQANGFVVKAVDVDDIDAVKREHGVPADATSCHTGIVNGYVVEGHVPADAVQKMLKDKPSIAGIAVPGMPMGSPGMEVPGGQKEAFNVVSFDKAGRIAVYQKR
jgi:hypothetical protein